MRNKTKKQNKPGSRYKWWTKCKRQMLTGRSLAKPKCLFYFNSMIRQKRLKCPVPLFSYSYKPIVEFIDAQFEAYLQEELKIKRTLHSYHDTRIHACLYFIAPTGHSLKSLDLVTMKKLDSKVSLEIQQDLILWTELQIHLEIYLFFSSTGLKMQLFLW